MNNEEQIAANQTAAAVVELIDDLGLGVQAMEYLGQEKFKALMDMVREHERATAE